MAPKQQREEIAKRRLIRVLERHVIATSRTLEQKISDAGPFNQRIDAHIITTTAKFLVQEGVMLRMNKPDNRLTSPSNNPLVVGYS